MTSEHDAWASLHPLAAARPTSVETCPCGQDLDGSRGRHCPRCGTSIAARAA
ncbi:hypothetical protein [Nocardioides coralli]|uniref:hypothetical protein n=1 Tax=Nocardioides coralli TaxID=2872154 RepID=UPI001CA43DB6|nr:hypothetical protein [Nocardioides coralli]QZY30514.1 hypothetical protein K6T13_07675 [Nocardioides coralli]